jgi:hypothetical protein
MNTKTKKLNKKSKSKYVKPVINECEDSNNGSKKELLLMIC